MTNKAINATFLHFWNYIIPQPTFDNLPIPKSLDIKPKKAPRQSTGLCKWKNLKDYEDWLDSLDENAARQRKERQTKLANEKKLKEAEARQERMAAQKLKEEQRKRVENQKEMDRKKKDEQKEIDRKKKEDQKEIERKRIEEQKEIDRKKKEEKEKLSAEKKEEKERLATEKRKENLMRSTHFAGNTDNCVTQANCVQFFRTKPR